MDAAEPGRDGAGGRGSELVEANGIELNPVRLVLGALEDLRSIAASAAALPDMARRLASIQDEVEALNEEVRRMREGVDEVREEVTGVRGAVSPLEQRLETLHATVAPLGGAAARIRRLGRRSAPGG